MSVGLPSETFARAWIDERSNLRPNNVAVYHYMLERHLVPYFGNLAVADIREAHVRRWRKKLLDAGASAASIEKAYRLLKAVLNTAADDGLIRRNPCRIRGAGLDKSPERSVLTIRQVAALADAIGPRYRALILAAVFSSLGGASWRRSAALILTCGRARSEFNGPW